MKTRSCYLVALSLMILAFASSRQLQDNTTDGNTTINNSSSVPTASDNSSSVPSPAQPSTNPTSDPSQTTTTFVDELPVYIYSSKLNSTQRQEYLFWVNYKNSFNTNSGQLAKMSRYFAPESSTYYSTIYKSGWPFYFLSGVFFVLLLVYFVMRFIFGGFQGPKKHITNWFGYFAYILIFVGFLICLIFFGLSLSNSSKVHNSLNNVTDHIASDAHLLNSTLSNIESSVASLHNVSYKTNLSTFTTNIFNWDKIKSESQSYSTTMENFSEDMRNSETSRFNFQIVCIIFIPLLTIGLLVAFKLKKVKIVLTLSILLFVLIIPAFIIMGLNFSYFLLSIDFCKDIHTYALATSKPYSQKGVGFYLSCPSKPTQVAINTAMYELSLSFNGVITEVNNTLIHNLNDNLGMYKRNNSRFIDLADNYYNSTTNATQLQVHNGLYALYYTNNVLQGLNALSDCQSALDAINYAEEKFCYLNITMLFANLFYYFVGILGLLALAIGANKLVVLLNPVYQNLSQGAQLLNDASIN